MNYYQVLGIKQNATIKQIKTAYRGLSKVFHPDVNNGSQNEFKLIKNAYEVLIDKKKKEQYDKSGFINSKIDISEEIDVFIIEYLFEEILKDNNSFAEFMQLDKFSKQEKLTEIVDYHLKEQFLFLEKKKQENMCRYSFLLELDEKDTIRESYNKIIEKNESLIFSTEEQIKFLNLVKTRIDTLINLKDEKK